MKQLNSRGGGRVCAQISLIVADEFVSGDSQSFGVHVLVANNYEPQGPARRGADLVPALAWLCHDLELLAEEYDPDRDRQLGNSPQASSHVMLINSARNFSRSHGPAQERPH